MVAITGLEPVTPALWMRFCRCWTTSYNNKQH